MEKHIIFWNGKKFNLLTIEGKLKYLGEQLNALGATKDVIKIYRYLKFETTIKDLRRDVLLKTAYDILKKCNQDEFECDIYCLMEDIVSELGLDEPD